MIRILGIDPGLQSTGYGIIENRKNSYNLVEAGMLETSYKEKIEVRLKKIHKALIDIMDEHKPEVLILEKLYSHYKHPATAILMGHARGVICLIAGEYKIPVVSYSAKRIKQAITGNGNASKSQIQGVIAELLGLKSHVKYSDVADALALAIGYAHMERRI